MQGQVASCSASCSSSRSATTPTSRVAEEAERGTAQGPHVRGAASTRAIEEIAPAHGDAAHHTGDAATESRRQEGRHRGRDRRRREGSALGTDRLRGQEQAAVARTTPGPSSTAAWASATRVVRGARRRRRGQGPLRARGADRVPGQQDHRRARPREPGPARRCGSSTATCAPGCWPTAPTSSRSTRPASATPPRRRPRGSSARNRVRKSLTNVTNSAKAAGDEFDEMVADVERCLARIEGLVAAAGPSARPRRGCDFRA